LNREDGTGINQFVATAVAEKVSALRTAGQLSFVYLAPMRNACDADELRRVVDDVYHPPGAYPDAPLIFVAFQLFASCGPWCIAAESIFWMTRASTWSGSASNSFRAGGLSSTE